MELASASSPDQEMTMQSANRLAFTVTWDVSDGNAEKAAAIIARFAPEARKELGLELLTVNCCTENPSQFLFYEIFGDAAAFAAHHASFQKADPRRGVAAAEEARAGSIYDAMSDTVPECHTPAPRYRSAHKRCTTRVR
jgi:quinol monooxygenase YgiN